MTYENRFLAQCIKEAGQMLIDNCEDYVGKAEGLGDFNIRIDFPLDRFGIPEIEICKTHYPSYKTFDKLFALKEKLDEMKRKEKMND